MVAAVQYRTGINRQDGTLLKGFQHVLQSLAVIWGSRLNSEVMLLGFGSVIRDHLGDDLTPSLALKIYDDLVTSAHQWEPEFRVTSLQYVSISETGALGLKYSGLYFPEGRFGRYEIVETIDGVLPITDLGPQSARSTL